MQFSGILRLTTECAPITHPSPIETPHITITPSPIHTLLPIVTGATLYSLDKGGVSGRLSLSSPLYDP